MTKTKRRKKKPRNRTEWPAGILEHQIKLPVWFIVLCFMTFLILLLAISQGY